MDQALLDILCDPVTKVPLTRLQKSDLARLNQAIDAGEVVNVNGDAVQKPLEAALITENRKVIYPVEEDIPILLADRGIGTAQLNDF